MGALGNGGSGPGWSQTSPRGLPAVNGCLPPPHRSLLQRLHWAASVRKGRRVSTSGRSSTHTGTRVQASAACTLSLPTASAQSLVLVCGRAAARLGQGWPSGLRLPIDKITNDLF